MVITSFSTSHRFLFDSCLRVFHKPHRRAAVEPGVMESLREDHRHSVVDIADGRTGRTGEDYEAKLSVALQPGQSGQVQHRLRGTGRVFDPCRAGFLPFKVLAGRDQAAAVLHRGAEHGLFRCRLRAGVDNQSLAVKAWKAPEPWWSVRHGA